MAVNDVQWELGSAVLYVSSGATVTGYWGLGSAWVTHEYAAAGGVTGTGEVAGSGARAAGVAGVAVAATGAVAGGGAQAAGVSGQGSTGRATGGGANAAGAAQVGVAATGAGSGPGAEAAGEAGVAVAGEGTITGSGAEAAGEAAVEVAGTGIASGGGAEAAGSGTVGVTTATATGTLAGSGARAAGSAQVRVTATGRATGGGAELAAAVEAFGLDATLADALRLYASPGVEITHLRAVGTIPGVRILLAAARNGPGVGMLRYLDGSLYWRAPGSATFGDAVAATVDGEYLVTDGEDAFKFVRCQAYADYLQERDGRVFLADRYQNAIGHDDVTAAEALAGSIETWQITARNESNVPLYHVSAWVDFETSGLELSANGVDWLGGASLGDLSPAAEVTLHLRRTIGAEAAYDPAVLNHVHFAFGA